MKGVVTNRQIFFMLLFTLTSGSLINIPRAAIKASGTGAWFTLMLLTIVFAFGIFFIASLNKKFEGKTIHEYSKLIVGKFASLLIGFIYTSYFLFVVTLLFKMVADFIKISALPLTPTWVILLLFIGTAAYLSYKGITNIARLCEIYGAIFIVVSLSAHAAELIVGNIKYIQPFFELKQIKEYVFGMKDLIVPFLGIEILTIIPFGKMNNRKGILFSVLGVIYIGLFYSFAVEASVAVVGINDIVNYEDALVEALRETRLPGTVLLERVDLLFLTVGTIGIISGLCILFFTVTENVSKIFVNLNKNKIVLGVAFTCFVLSGFIIDSKFANNLFNFVVPIFGLITAFIIPISLYVIAKVKKL